MQHFRVAVQGGEQLPVLHGDVDPGHGSEGLGGGAEYAPQPFHAACEMRDAGCGMRRGVGHYASRIPHPASRPLGAESGESFGRVPCLQDVVIGVRQLTRRAVELDLLERPQRDSARTEIILGILPFIPPSLVPRPSSLDFRIQNRSQNEVHRSRGEQDAGDELEHRAQVGSWSSSRRRRSSSSGAAVTFEAAGGAAGTPDAARAQRRSTRVRAASATTITTAGVK